MRRFIAYGFAIVLLASCSTQEKDFQTLVQEDVIYYASFEQPAGLHFVKHFEEKHDKMIMRKNAKNRQ